jgi:hypothetical protein
VGVRRVWEGKKKKEERKSKNEAGKTKLLLFSLFVLLSSFFPHRLGPCYRSDSPVSINNFCSGAS